jgi:predicted site-specific integrase-resolvase
MYSTRQAAKLIGVHHITLHHWLHTGVVRPSIALRVGGRTTWGFTDRDVVKARKVKVTRKPGPKPKERVRR